MLFDSMLDTFGGFVDEEVTRRFHNRMKEVGGLFCCLNETPRGNVFYDMLFDVPHTDRFGREFKGEWEPILGP